MRYYPVFLDLVDQPCIVLGEGHFAEEKAASLREAGADVRVITSRDYRDGDLAGARLVIDASEDPEVNLRSWQEAEEAGILINVVDRPAQCRFIAPAVVRRDPLLIAISTSGESPFIASALRARLERWIGREWGPFVALVGRIRRELRRRGVPIAEQTKAYRRLMASDVRELLRSERTGEAEARAIALAQPELERPGRVALVGAGPGDPELITVRARELLADADYVLHDSLVSTSTLAYCGPQTAIEAVGKRGGKHSCRQDEITSRLIQLARAGHFVVRLKGGDPFVFGRGGEELQDLIEAGIDVEVVPGVSSAFAAPASIGIPVTQRGVSSSIAITNAHCSDWADRIRQLAAAADTLIVLMGREKLADVSAQLDGALPAALVGSATLPEQRSVTGTVATIARLADEAGIEAPATLIVGGVVSAVTNRTLVDL
ncbi:MAG TPA: uroporphyrinogen-III C-methyltransferase, partial [Candidatus Dormibacteraeota bacterium]|nr:uroporphyrinogen-III C-methyltransferase [Candidatus Dormibacteraeota bacterium]